MTYKSYCRPYIVYKISKKDLCSSAGLDSIGVENWTTHVKTLTFNLNLGSFWETQTIKRRCRFINNVKQQTEDKFIDDWTEKISCQNQQTKLRTYNTFSLFPKLATYVSDLTDTRLIAAVARLRLSSYNLEIERGRHTRPKTPVANRICRRCQTTLVDDEIHLLMRVIRSNPIEKLFSLRLENISQTLIPNAILNNLNLS